MAQIRRWSALFLAMGLLGSSALASASSITVLTEEEGGTEALVDTFYSALRAQIELHPDYQLDNVPRQDLMEVVLALGCTELDAECSAILREVTGSDYLAWTRFSSDDEGRTAHLNLWDLAAGDYAVRRSVAVPARSAAQQEIAVLMARSLLYAEEQRLTLTTEPPGATVSVGGEERGTTPLTLEGLPVGLLEVTLELEGFRTVTEELVVDIGENDRAIALSSAPLARERAPREPREPRPPREPRDGAGDFPHPALGYSLLGSGGAFVVTGIVLGVATRGTQSEFDDLVAEPDFDLTRAESLRDRGQRQATLTNVFLISGGVLAGTGALFTFLAHQRGGDAPSGDVTTRELRIQPQLGPRELGAEFSLRF